MPRTTLAATALSLVAALAACTNSDRQQPTEPAATDQQTTSAPSRGAHKHLNAPADLHRRLRRRSAIPPTGGCGPSSTATESSAPASTSRPSTSPTTASRIGRRRRTAESTSPTGHRRRRSGTRRSTTDFIWTPGVKTSTSGSLVAWFKPSGPDRSLVVYDTHEHRVLADVPIPACAADDVRCSVDGDRGYRSWATACTGGPISAGASAHGVGRAHRDGFEDRCKSPLRGPALPPARVRQGRQLRHRRGRQPRHQRSATRPAEATRRWRGRLLHAAGLDTGARTSRQDRHKDRLRRRGRRHGRLLLRRVRHHRQTAEPATADRLHPRREPVRLFQWLDDDRFAVMAGATHDFGLGGWSGYGDILVCDIAQERCTLAVPGPDGGPTSDSFGDGFRLVPHLTLPN